MASTVTINGVTITSSGNGSISISNGRVLIDGKDVTPDSKQITIEVHGNLQSLSADVCDKITISGTVGTVRTQSGDVECNAVGGGVTTMSGDVRCGEISGSASTMSGDISAAGPVHGGGSSASGRVRGV